MNYNKLWKLLIDKGMNKTQLHEKSGIGKSTITKMAKCKNVNANVLEKICIVLECDIQDIVEIEKNEK